MCVCVRIFIPMILPSAYLNDVSFLEMFGAFWSLLEPFRLRDTIFACVRSVEWRTRPLAALQLTAALGLWMFSKYVTSASFSSEKGLSKLDHASMFYQSMSVDVPFRLMFKGPWLIGHW